MNLQHWNPLDVDLKTEEITEQEPNQEMNLETGSAPIKQEMIEVEIKQEIKEEIDIDACDDAFLEENAQDSEGNLKYDINPNLKLEQNTFNDTVTEENFQDFEENFGFSIKEEQDNFTEAKVDEEGEYSIPIHLCEICFKPYKNIGSLKRHYQVVHGDSTLHTCPTCQRTFQDKNELDEHQEKQCEFRREMLNVNRLQMLSDVGRKPIQIEGSPIGDMLLKLDRQKMESHTFSCTFCPKIFKHKDKLKQHQLCHSDVRKFCCQICPAQFKRRSQFQAHMRCVKEKQTLRYEK